MLIKTNFVSYNQRKIMEGFNKNDKQVFFNRIKGIIHELNDGEKYCSITLSIGHENSRYTNLVCKKSEFDKYSVDYKLGDKVTIQFYLVSRFKAERWYTSATILDVVRDLK